MIWSSTMSWTSSTVTVWPQASHSASTAVAASSICASVSRTGSGTVTLAPRMALTIFATSKVASDPLRLMIFIGTLLGPCGLTVNHIILWLKSRCRRGLPTAATPMIRRLRHEEQT